MIRRNEAADKMKASYLKVKIFALEGPNLKIDGKARTVEDKNIEEKALKVINKIKPEIVFIGFGAPRQEKWLYRLYDKMDFRGAMVIGGTFDYISEKKEVPPKWIEDVNFEWLWRLFKGDQKAKRIFAAFPRFAARVFWQKLTNPS